MSRGMGNNAAELAKRLEEERKKNAELEEVRDGFWLLMPSDAF